MWSDATLAMAARAGRWESERLERSIRSTGWPTDPIEEMQLLRWLRREELQVCLEQLRAGGCPVDAHMLDSAPRGLAPFEALHLLAVAMGADGDERTRAVAGWTTAKSAFIMNLVRADPMWHVTYPMEDVVVEDVHAESSEDGHAYVARVVCVPVAREHARVPLRAGLPAGFGALHPVHEYRVYETSHDLERVM